MNVIGLISGTSADGIDAAICEIQCTTAGLDAAVVSGRTYPYPKVLRKRVLNCYEPGQSSIDEICRLGFDLGEAFAEAAIDIVRETEGIEMPDIDLISSHGQTVWHEVTEQGDVHSTLQLGETAIIAEQTGRTTIGNLRARDIAAGGQGAPLAGYVDWLLLRDADKNRAIQNIGGIGNVTFVPSAREETAEPLAFDTGPGNSLIDDVLRIETNGRVTYDQGGELASSGEIDHDWLSALLAHEYYDRKPPKTTGRELFGLDMAQKLLTDGTNRQLSREDIIATLTALTAHSIARAYSDFAPIAIDEVLIGGGGRHNTTMLNMLQDLVTPARVRTQDEIGESSDLKEAMLCAVIGFETWNGRQGNHPAITGAKRPVVMGDITPGDNFESLMRATWCL